VIFINKGGDMAYRPYIWRKNNPEKRTEQKRRERVRKSLRDSGILPPIGEPMNDEQQEINNQIGNNDFSYWDKIKKGEKNDGSCDKQVKIKIKPPEYIIWYRAKENAKERKREFNLELSDIIIPEYCPYLGIKLSTSVEDRYQPYYYSIDRIDSNLGYVKGNVQVISKLANTMKNNATIEQLLIFSENIIRLYKPQVL
jgi:hypothetical protein